MITRLTSRYFIFSIFISITSFHLYAFSATSRCAQTLKNDSRINKLALTKLENAYRSRKAVSPIALLIDYSQNSKKRRALLVNLKSCQVLAHEYVIHGGTIYSPEVIHYGDTNQDGYLDRCQHKNGSRKYMSRPGLYITAGCHQSQIAWPMLDNNCKGIKLVGLSKTNTDAYAAGVVLHEHDLVPEDASIKPAGQGCPAFATGKLKRMMQHGLLKNHLVYIHAPQCASQN